MTDLAKLAAGLSPAQREQITRDAIGGDFTMATVRALRRKGLFQFVPDSPNGQCGPCRITPLGLAVRAHLLKDQTP